MAQSIDLCKREIEHAKEAYSFLNCAIDLPDEKRAELVALAKELAKKSAKCVLIVGGFIVGAPFFMTNPYSKFLYIHAATTAAVTVIHDGMRIVLDISRISWLISYGILRKLVQTNVNLYASKVEFGQEE